MRQWFRRTGVGALLLVVLASYVCLAVYAVRWDAGDWPVIYSAAIEHEDLREAPPDAQTLHITGTSLYRVSGLFVNGREVPVVYWTTINFENCLVSVPAGTFQPGETYTIQAVKPFQIFPGYRIYRSNKAEFTMEEAAES